MVHPRMTGSLIVFFVLSAGLAAAENPQIKAIQEEIKLLKAQESATVKALRAQYETYVRIDKLSEKELNAERDVLAKQEKELLGVASTNEDRDAIKAQYGTLRDALGKGARLDSKEIHAIRDQEKAHTRLVQAAYSAKIKELEAAVKLLEKAQPKGGKK